MDLKQFLELFNPYPGSSYLQVTDEVDKITDALYNLMESVNGDFHLIVYTEEELNLSERYPNANIQYIKSLKSPFRALPRTNDIVVFKDIFHKHENREGILKIAYTTLANAAEIVIIEKKERVEVLDILNILEKFEFRSQNKIDILEKYDLVMAKKLHMWGNGL